MTKKILFYIIGLFFLNSGFASAQEDSFVKIPPNLKVIQQQRWNDYEIKLLAHENKISLALPLDFYVVAYHETLKLPFDGTIKLAIESLENRAYKETDIKPEDQVSPALFKLQIPFEKVGQYILRVSFISQQGDFTQLDAPIEVVPSTSMMNYQKNYFMILLMVAFVFAVVYLIKRRAKKDCCK